MSHLFDSSKCKVARGKHHISDFERQSVEFFATNPYRQIVEIDPNTAEEIHKVKLVKPIPVALPAIASDAVNNLRSALDHVLYGVKLAAGIITEGNRAYFPFSNNVVEFNNTVNGRCKGLPEEITQLISEFKGYKGGNNLLWALNELSNTDKHGGFICPVALANSSFTLKRGTFNGLRSFSVTVWNRTKNEMELFRLQKGGTAKVDFKFTKYISIRDVEFVDGKPADAVLNEFVRIVERIIMAIEAESRRIGLI
jgi:hypothetical protein